MKLIKSFFGKLTLAHTMVIAVYASLLFWSLILGVFGFWLACLWLGFLIPRMTNQRYERDFGSMLRPLIVAIFIIGIIAGLFGPFWFLGLVTNWLATIGIAYLMLAIGLIATPAKKAIVRIVRSLRIQGMHC